MSPTHMSYIRSRKGWYKKYQGQLYQVSCKQLGVPPTKDQSMIAANAWWEAKQAEIDAQAKATTAQPHPRSDEIIQALEANLGVKFNNAEEAQAGLYGMILEHANGNGHLPDWFSEAVLGRAKIERIREGMATLTGDATPALRSVGEQVEQWLALLRASVDQKQIDLGRYDAYSRHVKIFRDWIGGEAAVDAINAHKLEQWWATLATKVAEKAYSPSYAKMIFMTTKQFISRLGELGIIPLPGNIRSRRFKFGDGPQAVERFSLEEVKKLLSTCDGYSERTRLYILLMLNCGMYQSDVSDVGDDEVNWTDGTLTRSRSKTPKAAKVKYKLWPETFALLRQFRAKEAVPNERGGNRVILTEQGKPLVHYWLEEGKVRRYDVIQSAFSRLMGRAKVKKPIKLLRKTAASELAAHESYGQFTQYFLAHSPKGVTDRHYVQPDDARFFAALKWLRSRFLD